MQIAPVPTTVTRRQLCKTIFYMTPGGELIAVLGNAHMIVSPEEAIACFQRLLDSTGLVSSTDSARTYHRRFSSLSQRNSVMTRHIDPSKRPIQEFYPGLAQLPIDLLIVQYIRKSTLVQVKNNKQSAIQIIVK